MRGVLAQALAGASQPRFPKEYRTAIRGLPGSTTRLPDCRPVAIFAARAQSAIGTHLSTGLTLLATHS